MRRSREGTKLPLNTYSWEKGKKPPIGKNLFLSRFLAWLRGGKRKEKKKVFLRDEPVSRNIKRYWGSSIHLCFRMVQLPILCKLIRR